MKRKPKLTKREKKAMSPPRAAPAAGKPGDDGGHIHCVACGKHLEPTDFDAPAVATVITCDHGSKFASCTKCVTKSTALVKEHDATNKPVRFATAWH
jgi:hypothetical protein